MRGARREGGGGSSRVVRWAAQQGGGGAAGLRTRVTSGTACTASVLSMSRSSMRGSSLRGGEDALAVRAGDTFQTMTGYLMREGHTKSLISMESWMFSFTAPSIFEGTFHARWCMHEMQWCKYRYLRTKPETRCPQAPCPSKTPKTDTAGSPEKDELSHVSQLARKCSSKISGINR